MIKNGTGTEQAWAVFNKAGQILLNTIRTRREDAIATITSDKDVWAWAKQKYNYYVAKVEVTVKAEVKEND